MTVLDAEPGSSFGIIVVATCLSFPTRLISLESEFYNFRYSKTSEERSESKSSKNKTVTVQMMTNFDCLRGIIGYFFPSKLVASCLSFPLILISFESKFYNSRYI